MPPRSPNPFATHLPVLLGLGRALSIRYVLELGCGVHSTLAFLDRRCFPHVERLDSCDNALDWVNEVRDKAAGDSRLNLQFVEGAIKAAVAQYDLEAYDLIFADDSTSLEARSATIREVARRRPQKPVLVMHDFEQPLYQQAAKEFRRRHRFTGLSPNTGAAWNGRQLRAVPLRRLNRMMRLQRGHFDPGDREAWLKWMDEHFIKPQW